MLCGHPAGAEAETWWPRLPRLEPGPCLGLTDLRSLKNGGDEQLGMAHVLPGQPETQINGPKSAWNHSTQLRGDEIARQHGLGRGVRVDFDAVEDGYLFPPHTRVLEAAKVAPKGLW